MRQKTREIVSIFTWSQEAPKSEPRVVTASTPLFQNDRSVEVPCDSVSAEDVHKGFACIGFPLNQSRKINKDGAQYFGFAQGIVRDYYKRGALCLSKQRHAGTQLTTLITRWVRQECPGHPQQVKVDRD